MKVRIYLRNASKVFAEVTQLRVVSWKNILLKLVYYLSIVKV